MSRLPLGQIVVGDAVATLRTFPNDSVDCVITSPPYFALRNYGVDGQLGLEESVDEWIAHLVEVITEVERVLAPHGSLWLNLGDSYARHLRHGAPPKGLVLAPEKLLLRLAARGWTVRNKVVWAKRNPMPSSVGDRLTASWEPIYLLVRSRLYYFDLDAIRVTHRSKRRASTKPVKVSGKATWAGPLAGKQDGLDRLHAAGMPGHPLGKNPSDVWLLPASRSVGGHHATFPEALIERPILAGCPERVCTRCAQPWCRRPADRSLPAPRLGDLQPVCDCASPWRPGVVLDPFMGSGTTAVVAERQRRDWVGIELNPRFAASALRRVQAQRSRLEIAA